MWWKWMNCFSYMANVEHDCLFFVQFNCFMCKLSYWTFWTLPSFQFFHSWDYWQLLFTFGKALQRPVIHKAEIHSDLKFSSYRFLQISQQYQNTKYTENHTKHKFFTPHTVTLLQYIQKWTCSLLSVILCLFYWPSWTSVDIFLLTALLLSAEISNTEEINSGREEKLGQWKWIFTL